MPEPSRRRLPFGPLNDVIGVVLYERAHGTASRTWLPIPGNHCTILSELTGIGRHNFVKWAKKGVPEERADQIAVALGLHVSLIWPCWFDEAVK